MKILNSTNIFFTIPYFFGNQLKYFTDKGHEIHLSCSPSPQVSGYAQSHGCKYVEIAISRRFDMAQDLKSLRNLIVYIRKNKFDIVSGHTPKAGMLTMLASKLTGTKKRIYFRHGLVYETAHGLARQILIWSERLASFCATDVVCVSPYLIERSLSDNLTKRSKLTILNRGSCTGIDAANYFNPDKCDSNQVKSIRKKLAIPEDAFTIGFVGRMVRDKGVVELIDAYKRLDNSDTNLRLLLVGPLESRDGLPEDAIYEIENNPRIIHVGLVEDNINLYYSIMDLFVMPTHREGLGVALLEAQAMRIPVLTTSHSGARDAILPNVTGRFINMDSDSIKRQIEVYMSDPQLRIEHGRAGRDFIIKNFSEELIWREIEKLYE